MKSASRTSLLGNCVRQTLVWLPVAVATVYLKLWTLTHAQGEWKILAALRRIKVSGVVRLHTNEYIHHLSFLEKLSLVRSDLLWSVILVPAFLCACAALGRPRLQRWLWAAAAILILLAVYVQAESYSMFGRFQSWELIVDGWQWGIRDAGSAMRYFNWQDVCRGAAGIAAVIGLAAVPASIIERYVARPLARHRHIGYAALAAPVAVCALAWLPWLPTTAYHKFALGQAVRSLFRSPLPPGHEEIAALSPEQLRARYRELVNAPLQGLPSPYFGQAKGYDVLYFVMETMPSKCVSFDAALDDLPNIASLKPHAWVATSHYSTYPNTIRALFSLMTGMYPPDGSLDLVGLDTNSRRGLPYSLNRAGYETAAYGSSGSIMPTSRRTFQDLGFKRIRSFGPGSASEADPSPSEAVLKFGTDKWIRRESALDRAALDGLKQDMEGWIDRDQRYAAVYLPQISHGPWVDVKTGGKETDLMKRGRNLVASLDQSLGELLDLLRRRGRLGRTLIVVTGDHGLRNWNEVPSGLPSLMDEYAYGVPFLLYAPGVLDHSERIPYVTSHIDVAPSILDLIGISAGREMEQGAPLWDPCLASRDIYFWGNQLQGNDGLYSGGKFYGWDHAADAIYANRELHFEPDTAQLADSPARRFATDHILEMSALQMAWFRRPGAASE